MITADQLKKAIEHLPEFSKSNRNYYVVVIQEPMDSIILRDRNSFPTTRSRPYELIFIRDFKIRDWVLQGIQTKGGYLPIA